MRNKKSQNWEVLDASFHNFFFMCPSACLICTLVISIDCIDHNKKLWSVSDVQPWFPVLFQLLRLPWRGIQSGCPTQGKTTSASYCNAKKQHSKKLQGGWSEHRQANRCRCCFSPMLHSSRPYHSLPKEIFFSGVPLCEEPILKAVLVKLFVPLVSKRKGRLSSRQN